MKIGVVVGEISGDALAAPLIHVLKSISSKPIEVVGIGGPQLIEAGCRSLFPFERLNVMGLFQPLKRLPELYRIRQELIRYFREDPPDVFIGVDAPDFNLGLERRLKAFSIPTVHYVSPTVWAWRKNRIHKIKQSVDLMLTLFPFETKIYDEHHIPVCFAGHPYADEIPLEIDSAAAKKKLHYQARDTVIALLPGTRTADLHYHAKTFIETAGLCAKTRPDLKFIIPVVNQATAELVQELIQKFGKMLSIQVVVGKTRLAIAASDAVLVKSGTATLEVMLHKKPMVVAYLMNSITHSIARFLVDIPHIALPNILAGQLLVPEFIQNQATPQNLSQALLAQLESHSHSEALMQSFDKLHQQLKQNASHSAAKAVLGLIENL